MIRKLEGVLDDMCSVIEYYERKAMDILEIDEELKHRIYVRLGEELE